MESQQMGRCTPIQIFLSDEGCKSLIILQSRYPELALSECVERAIWLVDLLSDGKFLKDKSALGAIEEMVFFFQTMEFETPPRTWDWSDDENPQTVPEDSEIRAEKKRQKTGETPKEG
jgi:hypothetical protein